MPSAIVTTHYRYKRPPRKKPIVLTGSAIVTPPPKRKAKAHPPAAEPARAAAIVRQVKAGNDNRSVERPSAIVTIKRRPGRFGDAPDLTDEEHRRRGDAADALFREIVRRATE